jgi:hypothetical protein
VLTRTDSRGELVKPGNEGLKDTVEEADELFVAEGASSSSHLLILLCSQNYHSGKSRFQVIGYHVRSRES